jgi:hypothetical protein
MIFKKSFVVLLFCEALYARTDLGGSINYIRLSAENNPCIINSDVIIPKDGQLIIEEGCHLLFKPFAGIIVEGKLRVVGTVSNPVIFTSYNDSLAPDHTNQRPNPFDWNGIFIQRQAHVSISNFKLAYSVYGIKTQNESITIENGRFTQNGQFNLTVNEKIMPVVDNMPFNYKRSEIYEIGPERKRLKLSTPTLSTSIGGATCLGVMGFFIFRNYYCSQNYNRAKTQEGRESYKLQKKTSATIAVISAVTGGALITVGGVLFVLDYKKERKEIKIAIDIK